MVWRGDSYFVSAGMERLLRHVVRFACCSWQKYWLSFSRQFSKIRRSMEQGSTFCAGAEAEGRTVEFMGKNAPTIR